MASGSRRPSRTTTRWRQKPPTWGNGQPVPLRRPPVVEVGGVQELVAELPGGAAQPAEEAS